MLTVCRDFFRFPLAAASGLGFGAETNIIINVPRSQPNSPYYKTIVVFHHVIPTSCPRTCIC